MGILASSVQLIASGLLAATLFGVMGKMIHLLESIDDHLGRLREERRTSPTRIALVPEEYMVSERGTIRPQHGAALPGSRERPH